MIIARHRDIVIDKIKKSAQNGQLNNKVEPDDPKLRQEQSNAIIRQFWQNKTKKSHQVLAAILRKLLSIITPALTQDCKIEGLANLKAYPGAFITCNHYNQLDILLIKKLAMKQKRQLYFMVEDTNLVMHFPIGFLVRNADVIPVNRDLDYIGRKLPALLEKIFSKQAWILIYPEQQMWFNYRKPRPLKKGAYYYAAKLNKPIISCFVELRDRKKRELFHRNFHKTEKILHVLTPILPDPKKSVHENMLLMRKQDYLQKKAAYEEIYQKKLNYKFQSDDIAGWRAK